MLFNLLSICTGIILMLFVIVAMRSETVVGAEGSTLVSIGTAETVRAKNATARKFIFIFLSVGILM